MFQLVKLGLTPSGTLDITKATVFSKSSNDGSLSSGFNYRSGGVYRVPIILKYSVDNEEIEPVLSDIILSLTCALSSSSFAQEYSFERYDSNSNYVYFKHLDTGKTVKCRLFLPKTYLDVTDPNACASFNVYDSDKLTVACPDESGTFYISDNTDFSIKSIFFVLEFNFEAQFVSAYNSEMLFQLGFNILSLSSASSSSSEVFTPSDPDIQS